MNISRFTALELVLCFLFLGGAFTFTEVLAESVTPPFEIQVDVNSLNVRDTPPWFSYKTIITFKYSVNPPIDVLEHGQRANAFEKRLIGSGKLWLHIKYTKDGQPKSGWVYAGTEQNIVNIQIIRDSQGPSTSSRNHSIETSLARSQFSLFNYFIGAALADTTAVQPNKGNNKQVDPNLNVPRVKVVFVLLIYVVAFVASLLATHKVTSNGFLSFFAGLGVLLILGFITPALFSSSLGLFK